MNKIVSSKIIIEQFSLFRLYGPSSERIQRTNRATNSPQRVRSGVAEPYSGE